MIRLFRLPSGVVPSFLTQKAAILGRQRPERLHRGVTRYLVWADREPQSCALGWSFALECAPAFFDDRFDFEGALPPSRGTPEQRVEWLGSLHELQGSWSELDTLLDEHIGPALGEHISALRPPETMEQCTWAAPVEMQDPDTNAEWWTLRLSNGEEVLLFKGGPEKENFHSVGWMLPGVGPSKSKRGTVVRTGIRPKPYIFEQRVVEVFTWLRKDEEAFPVTAPEHVFRIS